MDFINLYPDQDPKNLYLYEIIGSYFTDVVFNHIYLNTKIKLVKDQSFLEEYTKRLQLYIIGIKNDKKCYLSVYNGLHKYYDTVLNKNSSEQAFCDIILNAFVPPDFIEEINNSNKLELISNIICDLVSNLIGYASSPRLAEYIISKHNEKSNETIKMLQDYSIHVLINKKINLINKIIKETGQVKEEPPIEVIDNMKSIIKSLVLEKNELIEEINQRERKINELIENEKKLKKLISLLNIQTNIYKKHSKKNDMQNEFIQEVIQTTENDIPEQKSYSNDYKNILQTTTKDSNVYKDEEINLSNSPRESLDSFKKESPLTTITTEDVNYPQLDISDKRFTDVSEEDEDKQSSNNTDSD